MQAFLARWMPIDVSAHGAPLDALNSWVHWLMAILFVGWGLYFVYVLFRFRAGAHPKASYEGAHSHFSQYIEAGVAIVEVILLVGFAIPAWATWVAVPPEGSDLFVVRVTGQQFNWNVHYPGPDGVFGRTDINLVDDAIGNNLGLDRSDPAARDDVFSLNNLYLPVDRDIEVQLASRDVIHSFFLPQLRVKQDAIPGMMIPVHFRALQATPPDARNPECLAGSTCWEIACAQLCGLGHYRMKGWYTIFEEAEFDAWMADQQSRLAATRPPLPGGQAAPVTTPEAPVATPQAAVATPEAAVATRQAGPGSGS